jgi:hypothetical protein
MKPEFERTVTQYDLYKVRYQFQQFKITLLAEFNIVNAYFVTQKGGFDTASLLFWGENCFPPDLVSKVPEAIFDVREAIAYELPTAVGFHVFRVLESVLRRYYVQVTGGAARPRQRNIAVYVNAIRQAKRGDERILSTLKQISDLHRNPIAHPEVILSLDEAIATMGITHSAITAMLSILPVAPQTTGTTPVIGP